VTTCSLNLRLGELPTPPLQRTNGSVASLPLPFAAERQYRKPDFMNAIDAISHLLDVLNTSVSGQLMERLVAEHALIGPNDCGYWENSRAGISLGSDGGVVTAIFLHGFGKDDFAQFSGPLPAGLTFESGPEEVRHALGAPETSGGPDKMPRVYHHGGWDRFTLGSYSIHFTYRAHDKRIDLVTLMPREPANRALNPPGLRPAG
jgi:hypothetical protein